MGSQKSRSKSRLLASFRNRLPAHSSLVAAAPRPSSTLVSRSVNLISEIYRRFHTRSYVARFNLECLNRNIMNLRATRISTDPSFTTTYHGHGWTLLYSILFLFFFSSMLATTRQRANMPPSLSVRMTRLNRSYMQIKAYES